MAMLNSQRVYRWDSPPLENIKVWWFELQSCSALWGVLDWIDMGACNSVQQLLLNGKPRIKFGWCFQIPSSKLT